MGSTVHTRCCAKCASASQLAELQTSFGEYHPYPKLESADS